MFQMLFANFGGCFFLSSVNTAQLLQLPYLSLLNCVHTVDACYVGGMGASERERRASKSCVGWVGHVGCVGQNNFGVGLGLGVFPIFACFKISTWFINLMELLQSSRILKQKNYNELFYEIFCLKFFTTPNSKNIIATLRIVTNLNWHSFLYCISMINLN